MSITQTPQQRSSSRPVSGKPPKVAASRTCERPTKAKPPGESEPAREAGQLGDGLDAAGLEVDDRERPLA